MKRDELEVCLKTTFSAMCMGYSRTATPDYTRSMIGRHGVRSEDVIADKLAPMSVTIIAEAGVNHNGDASLAEDLVAAAAHAGADVVKFQTFDPSRLVTACGEKAKYQALQDSPGESQREMLEAYRLDEADLQGLMRSAARVGIAFMSTPFDEGSLSLLTETLGLTKIKLSSGDITNGPLLLAAARAAHDIILSTGMSTLDEVRQAVAVLGFGFLVAGDAWPTSRQLSEILEDTVALAALRSRVTLLHCVSTYPTPVADVNLRAMDALWDAFGIPVGYSDHTTGVHVSVGAVARGASVIEKHLTLDRGMPGPDHAASLEPAEFAEMVRGIREIESALGDGVKRPVVSEADALLAGRRSPRAARAVRRGERLTAQDIVVLRPGDGRSPMTVWDIVGTFASRDYALEENFD